MLLGVMALAGVVPQHEKTAVETTEEQLRHRSRAAIRVRHVTPLLRVAFALRWCVGVGRRPEPIL